MQKLVLLLFLLPGIASAEMYRWVDKQGKVHYSQIRPPAAEGQPSVVAPAPAVNAPSSNDGLRRYAEQLGSANANRDQTRDRAQQESERKQQRCSQARGQLKLRNDYEGRTFSYDEKGDRSYWTAEQTQSERNRLQGEIAANCQD